MRETVFKKKAKYHHSDTNKKRRLKAKFLVHKKALRQVLLLQNLFIKFKAMMMTNGPLLSSLILNFSKKKKNCKKWENKSLRKKSKNNSISKWKKNAERKNGKKNKVKSTLNSNNNRPNSMMKEKKKKKKSIKEKSNSKRRWETDKSRMKIRERKLKRKKKINLINSWSQKSKRKSLSKKDKWESVNKKNSTDFKPFWRKMSKMKEDSKKKPRDKNSQYFFILHQDIKAQ